jgi:serine protease Do
MDARAKQSWAGIVVGVVAGCTIGLALAVTGAVSLPDAIAGSGAAQADPNPVSAPGRAPDGEVVGDGVHSRFAILARAVAPGVVNVHTEKTVDAPELGPLGDLFGGLFGPNPFAGPGTPPHEPSAPRRFSMPSLGTGFVISDDGLIVTNHHVVADVSKIDIVFQDGTRTEATIVGTDAKTEIALIRAKGDREYAALELGDSSTLLPGDWVIAVGNPFGLDHTVTAGIVSATGRDIGQGPYDDFIQTDAAINPGNSGGPLLNVAGQVVGINTAINPQANTIGFAVPSNMAKEILPQLEKNGRVVRGWLGVGVQPVTPDLADALELKTEQGALVSQVEPSGPAAKAGIERGDVIVRFGDVPIERTRDLPRAVASSPPGTEVEIELLRDGKHVEKTAEVAELADEAAPERVARSSPSDDEGSTAFGFDIQDVPDELRGQLDVEKGGALITRVYPGGPAARAGLRPGDVIEEVDREPVSGGLDAEEKLRGADDKALIAARREAGSFFAVVNRAES